VNGASLVCPKCGFAQPAAAECARCGIVIARFRREPAPAPGLHTAEAPRVSSMPAARSSMMPVIAILVVLAGLGASAYGLMKAKGAIETVTAVAAPRRARASSAVRAPDSRSARVEEPRSSVPASAEPPREEVREGTPLSMPVSDRPSEENAAAPQGRAPRLAVSSAWREGASGFADAESDRKRLGSPMAIYFFTGWCGWCRRLESAYLPAPEVEEYLSGVVRVRIDAESGAAERALAKRFGVRGYPSFFIVSADGSSARRVHPFRVEGHMSPAEFAAACRDAE
jgi:thiol-disulfide isomerase/thioredoxin